MGMTMFYDTTNLEWETIVDRGNLSIEYKSRLRRVANWVRDRAIHVVAIDLTIHVLLHVSGVM